MVKKTVLLTILIIAALVHYSQTQFPQPGQELIFSNNGPRASFEDLFAPIPISRSTDAAGGNGLTGGGSGDSTNQPVLINNVPTVATMAPFMTRTTPSSTFSSCFNNCPSTSEYNPICGSNQELYFNEQKFNCAVRCGADIQIVRRGSCAGLFPMQRG